DEFDQAQVSIGDGTNGAVPPRGAQLAVSYRTGGGRLSNVEAGTITKLTKTYKTSAGKAVKVTVTNPARASGGDDRETEEHGKLYGPRSLRTAERSVSKGDYETCAELVPGVARALAETVDDDPSIDENTVVV